MLPEEQVVSQFYVTDTHSLLWHLYDIPLLASGAKLAFSEVESGSAVLLIPTIVLAELVFVIEHRKHDIDVNEMLSYVMTADNYRIVPFDMPVAICLAQETAISEIHDRIIVCTALAYQAPLITRDREITASGRVQTIWE